MRLEQALKLHLGSKVYKINDSIEIEELMVVHMVFRGTEDVRVIAAENMKNWDRTETFQLPNIYYSYEDACKGCECQLRTKKLSLERQIARINKKLLKAETTKNE